MVQNRLVSNIILNIILCVQQDNKIYTGLEQFEGRKIWIEFSFLGEPSLNFRPKI